MLFTKNPFLSPGHLVTPRKKDQREPQCRYNINYNIGFLTSVYEVQYFLFFYFGLHWTNQCLPEEYSLPLIRGLFGGCKKEVPGEVRCVVDHGAVLADGLSRLHDGKPLFAQIADKKCSKETLSLCTTCRKYEDFV